MMAIFLSPISLQTLQSLQYLSELSNLPNISLNSQISINVTGVRRFIRALEKDGIACEMKHRQKFLNMQYAASQNLAGIFFSKLQLKPNN